jgi:hypothetical protein
MAIQHKITYITTMAAARASVEAIAASKKGKLGVCSLQEYHLLRDKKAGAGKAKAVRKSVKKKSR